MRAATSSNAATSAAWCAARFGAHPTSNPPAYGWDLEHLKAYCALASESRRLGALLQPNSCGRAESEYLASVGGVARLTSAAGAGVLSMPAHDYTLAELLIVAAAEAWRGNGEVLASGIGVVPRLAASLAKLTHSPELMMTDAEAYLVEEPVPLGPRGDYRPKLLRLHVLRARLRLRLGRAAARHDRADPDRPLRSDQPVRHRRARASPRCRCSGMRGLPGNSISHPNSMFVPNHSPRVFVAGRSRHRRRRGLQPGALARGGERGARRPAPHRHRPVRHGLQRRGRTRSACVRCTPASALGAGAGGDRLSARSRRGGLPTTPPPTSEQLRSSVVSIRTSLRAERAQGQSARRARAPEPA